MAEATWSCEEESLSQHFSVKAGDEQTTFNAVVNLDI